MPPARPQVGGDQDTAGCHLGSGHLRPCNHHVSVTMETNGAEPSLRAVCDVICSHMAAVCGCVLLLLLLNSGSRRRRRDQLCCPVGGSRGVAAFLPDIPLRSRAENHAMIKASHVS